MEAICAEVNPSCLLAWNELPRKGRGKNYDSEALLDRVKVWKLRTRATLVRGECSHHCTIPAPQPGLKAPISTDKFSRLIYQYISKNNKTL